MARAADPHRPGSALVLALWIALLLGAAGAAAIHMAASGAGGAQTEADLARARAAAEGGIWAMAHLLAARPVAARPPRAEITLPLGGVRVVVSAADEDGRLDLNSASDASLSALLRAAGMDEADASAAAMRIVAWRERDGRHGIPSGQDGVPFRAVADLAAVPRLGLPLAEALRGVVTVHTSRGEPAMEAAPPALFAALHRPAEPIAPRRGLRTPRREGPGGRGRRTVWRIEAEARSGAVVARTGGVLALTPAGGVPGRILEWRPVGP